MSDRRWMGALKQRRDCRRKRWFGNERAAAAAISAEEWHTRDEGVTLRPYKCQWCPGWHLTSQSERRAS